MKKKIDDILSEFLLNDKYGFLRHSILLLLILLITLNIFWDTPDEFIFTQERFYAWIIYFVILALTIYASAYILVPRFLIRGQYLKFTVTAFLLVLFSIALIGFLQGVLFEPTVTGRPEPESVNSVFMNVLIVISSLSSIVGISLVIAGVSALMLFRHWMRDTQKVSRLQAATLQSELSFLKSQINPHFLFNMLNNANIMVDEDPAMASGILLKLDDLLRYQFNESTQDLVQLQADIVFLRDFLDLEKTRRDQFEYNIAIEGNSDGVQVPPLLFIPFVENAVKHNTDSTKASYVYLTFTVENNRLTFVCENSKPLNPVNHKNGGLGLANIRRRLDLLFDNHYTLEVHETEADYNVHLTLQLDKLFTNKPNYNSI